MNWTKNSKTGRNPEEKQRNEQDGACRKRKREPKGKMEETQWILETVRKGNSEIGIKKWYQNPDEKITKTHKRTILNDEIRAPIKQSEPQKIL